MRSLTALAALLALSTPAFAAGQKDAEPDKPVTDKSVSATDVATTPVTDLGLKKQEIPPLLISAQAAPYSTAGLAKCPALAAAVGELDAVLGDDIDLPQEEGKTSAGQVAQAAVGAFIPFRGLIREVSGANSNERKMRAAIQAGMARRAFLKGMGEARGCRYPARSATQAVIAAVTAERAKPGDADKNKTALAATPTPAPASTTAAKAPTKMKTIKRKGKNGKVTYVQVPVVQKTN